MEFIKVLNYIAKEFPEEAVNLTECIELITDTLDDTLNKLQQRMNKQIIERKLDGIESLVDYIKQISELENEILDLRNELEPDADKQIVIEKEEESRILPNYGDYAVDIKIPHSLYENFAHKRPVAFELFNERYECRTWIEVLTCFTDVLARTNTEILLKFNNDVSMNGKKSKYFSNHSEELRKPYLIKGTDLYLETNMSANSVRNIILKMLQRYGYRSNDIVIYLRADYTDLHKN